MTANTGSTASVSEIVTDTASSVYFFTDNQPPALIGAAMARVSRSSSDLREIWRNEFSADGLSQTEGLIGRVVTGFGDDSVQQLTPVQFAMEGISNWATKLVEWPRIGMGYLEQSTRYIFFDQKDADGRWKYYIPENLSPSMRARYCANMDLIFTIYSEIVHTLTEFIRERDAHLKEGDHDPAWMAATKAKACDAARLMLPTATRSTVGFTGNAQSLSNLIIHLRSQSMVEAQDLADQLIEQARRLPYLAPFLERVDLPDRGLADALYRRTNRENMRELNATRYARSSDMGTTAPYVKLVEFEPRTERELTAWLLIATADGLTLPEAQILTADMVDDEVAHVIQTYIGERLNRRHKPGRGTERAHFWWEVLDDYGTFRDLQRHRMVDAFEWQRLTTLYGYSVPDAITDAGLEDQFRRCFEISAELYDHMVFEGYAEEAQYATLLGHRLRYTFGTNLRELFHFIELRTQPAGHDGYRAICQEMYRQLCEVYPQFGEAMCFVNTTGESDDLNRLAAERATRAKW